MFDIDLRMIAEMHQLPVKQQSDKKRGSVRFKESLSVLACVCVCAYVWERADDDYSTSE